MLLTTVEVQELNISPKGQMGSPLGANIRECLHINKKIPLKTSNCILEARINMAPQQSCQERAGSLVISKSTEAKALKEPQKGFLLFPPQR